MGRPTIDITGKKSGKLMAIRIDGRTKNKEALWLCQCECGNTTRTVASKINKGRVCDCGKCITYQGLVGKEFGRWKVLSLAVDKGNAQKSRWLCECSCKDATRREVVGETLLRGRSKSCGCFMREQKAAQVGERHWNWKGGPDNWAINQPGAKAAYAMMLRRKLYREDPQYRLASCLRGRLRYAIKNRQKTGSAIRDLGCSIAYLTRYIEALWEPWMNWGNYGNRKGQWSIDHIIPLSAFDLTDRQQLLKAVHYTNLRPLPQCRNRDKWDRVPTRAEHRAIMKEIRAKTAHLGNPT